MKRIAVLSLLLAGCSNAPDTPGEAVAPAAAAPSPVAESTAPAAAATQPADIFLGNLRALCGQAFAGRIVANEPPSTTPDPFEGKQLVMHVRECADAQVKVPFHVGDDHSRTWVLTRVGGQLRLKHDHRHVDGSPDAVTMYGGDTVAEGTPLRQEFPVDAGSVAMFEREGLAASVTNVWAMELDPGRNFVYELSRPGGRLFRVEFDLSNPVTPPPAPWGSE